MQHMPLSEFWIQIFTVEKGQENCDKRAKTANFQSYGTIHRGIFANVRKMSLWGSCKTAR